MHSVGSGHVRLTVQCPLSTSTFHVHYCQPLLSHMSPARVHAASAELHSAFVLLSSLACLSASRSHTHLCFLPPALSSAMSYWFDSNAPEPKPTRPRVHIPSHNPCDWTNPIVPKRRPMPPGYVAPGERLRRIAAALDAEWDEKQDLKMVSGVMQSAEWHQKTQQKTRNAVNKRAQRMSDHTSATVQSLPPRAVRMPFRRS